MSCTKRNKITWTFLVQGGCVWNKRDLCGPLLAWVGIDSCEDSIVGRLQLMHPLLGRFLSYTRYVIMIVLGAVGLLDARVRLVDVLWARVWNAAAIAVIRSGASLQMIAVVVLFITVVILLTYLLIVQYLWCDITRKCMNNTEDGIAVVDFVILLVVVTTVLLYEYVKSRQRPGRHQLLYCTCTSYQQQYNISQHVISWCRSQRYYWFL